MDPRIAKHMQEFESLVKELYGANIPAQIRKCLKTLKRPTKAAKQKDAS